MGLLDRVLHNNGDSAETPTKPSWVSNRKQAENNSASFAELKTKVHRKLVETVDVSKIDSMDPAVLSAQLSATVNKIFEEEGRLLTEADRGLLTEEIKNELLGLGPLEHLLADDEVSDILINGFDRVYVERRGRLHKTEVVFRDVQHLMSTIDRIVSQVGRRVDEASPMVDARLWDGSRFNAIIPPLALDGPSVSIRRFGKDPLTMDNLIRHGTLEPKMAEFLSAIVHARLNVLICGGTGSGKTTMLNCLSSFIPHHERIITIEDAAELCLQQPHVVRLECRPPNLEGKGEITQRDLLRNTLRMRPDRIIVGEVRGSEVLDMLQAMSTGHDGSIATIHANNPRDSLSRLEMMMLFAGVSLPERAMRQQITAAINIIVHVSRLSDGSRKVMKIAEITGMEGDTVMMQDLFEFAATGIDGGGKVQGSMRATGIRSTFTERLRAAGLSLEARLFQPEGG
jgi:pilus assembly protein CpaF